MSKFFLKASLEQEILSLKVIDQLLVTENIMRVVNSRVQDDTREIGSLIENNESIIKHSK